VKKLLALLVIVGMLAVTVGCSGSTTSKPASTGAPSTGTSGGGTPPASK